MTVYVCFFWPNLLRSYTCVRSFEASVVSSRDFIPEFFFWISSHCDWLFTRTVRLKRTACLCVFMSGFIATRIRQSFVKKHLLTYLLTYLLIFSLDTHTVLSLASVQRALVMFRLLSMLVYYFESRQNNYSTTITTITTLCCCCCCHYYYYYYYHHHHYHHYYY